MEKHLKERLVGAAVLVAIGVILIPLLLDGPEPRQTRRIGLELPGAGPDLKTHVIRLDESGQKTLEEAPAPVAANGESGVIGGRAEAADEAPAPIEQKPPVSPAPAAEASPPAADPAAARDAPVTAAPERPAPAATGDWYVQVGSFSETANATRLRDSLVKAGYDAQLSRVNAGGRTLHRVRVGPVTSRDEAEALAGRLARAGHKGRVVADGD